MLTIRTAIELRAALRTARAAERTVGLVPTMGALHDGHLSLIAAARAQCDLVVMSLFVNPAQFDDPRDAAIYPRHERRDAELAQDAGVDVLFAPTAEELYPPGFATAVRVRGLSETLEGAHRGVEHFDGVCTVVAKLLNIVDPDVAFFGRKDAQQALIVQRMTRDLHFRARIELLPTVRDDDGLALSSRNARLDAAERERALGLSEGLRAAERALAAGQRDAAELRGAALAALRAREVDPEYVELVRPDDLAPVDAVDGEALLAIAARVGDTRLIDNTILVRSPAESEGSG